MIYAKQYGVLSSPDQIGINHVFSIEQYIVPLDATGMLKQRNIGSFFFWIAFRKHSLNELKDPYREVFPEIDIGSLEPTQADIDEWVTRVSGVFSSRAGI